MSSKKLHVHIGNYGTLLVVALSASLFRSSSLFVVLSPWWPSSHIIHQCHGLNVVRGERCSIVRDRMVVREQNWARNSLYPTPHTFGEGTRGEGHVFIKKLFVQDTRFLALSQCWGRFRSVARGIDKRIGICIFTHPSGGCTLLSHDASKHRIQSFSIEFIHGKSGRRMAK